MRLSKVAARPKREEVMKSAAPSKAEQVFAAQLPMIQNVMRKICWRNRLIQEEAEDFCSYAYLKLIEDDYGQIRRFQGRCSLKTYLMVVMQRLFLDFRIQKWGKWRPSAKARRLGAVGVQLDRLMNRDRYSPTEAIEILKTNFRVEAPRRRLREMAWQIPSRSRPIFQGVDDLTGFPSEDDADQEVTRKEMVRIVRRTQTVLQRALRALPPEDRLILKLRCQDGMTIPQIASALDLAPRPLYRRIGKSLKELRIRIEGQGVTREDLRILGHPNGLDTIDFGLSGKGAQHQNGMYRHQAGCLGAGSWESARQK